QVGQVFRYRLDFFQCHTGVLRQACPFHHLGGGVFHGNHRFVGVGLNGFYQRFNLLGGGGGTFREALYLVRDHREAAACFAGHGRLDRRVQRENVGLVGDVVDQRYDVTDLLGRFTQPLDPLRGFLNLFADGVHAVDGRLYHFGALVGDGYRALRHRGGFGGVGGYLVNRHRHFVHGGGSAGDFLRLVLGRLGQVHRGGLRFLGGGGHLHGGLVNCLYQRAELVDGVVDGIRDGAGEVLGYRRLYRQVTVSEVAQFVEQTQNRGLVTLVLGFQFFTLAAALFRAQEQHDADHHQRGEGEAQAHRHGREHTGGGIFEFVVERGGLGQQVLGTQEDRIRRRTHLEQLRCGFQNLVHRLVDELVEQVGDLGQIVQRIRVGHLLDAERGIALDHAVEHAGEHGGITAEGIRRHHRAVAAFQYPRNGAHDPLRQPGLPLGIGHLVAAGAAADQDFHHAFVFGLQGGDGLGQGVGHVVQVEHGVFAVEN